MKRATLLPLIALLVAASARATGEPMIDFVVVRSDTLIHLSETMLVSRDAWREVAALNRLRNPNRIDPGQVLKIPARLMRSTPIGATLVSATGDVRIDNAPAASGAAITEGQSVQTGPGSSAVIALGDGSRLRMPPSSLAEVAANRRYGERGDPSSSSANTNTSATPDGASSGWFAGTMRVLRGSVEVFATKVLRAKPLEVVTPTAVVGVRGTSYRVSLDEGTEQRTRGEVTEGTVRFDVARGDSGADVAAGYGAVADASGTAPTPVKLLPAPSLASLPAQFDRPMVRFALPGETTPLRVQVASDAGFDKIVSDLRVAAGAEVRIAGLDDAKWFLRARRVDPQGIEGFDASGAFVLKARPEPPAHRAPRVDSKQPVGAVAFMWAPNAEAAQARLQISTDASFANLIEQRDGLTGATTTVELKQAGVYFWRMASVRANGDAGPFGDPQRFELRANPEPPTGGATANGLQFQWSGRPQDRQQTQFASDPEFKQIIATSVLKAPEWTVPMPSRGGRYYFRYRSVEPDGYVTPYSSAMVVDVPYDWRPLILMLLPALLL